MMRRPIALLVVLMMVFGPFVQGVDIQQEKSIEPVDPDVIEPPASIVRPDARELLSNIDGFFTENLGQKGEGAGRFYCQGSPLSVAFGDGWVAYDYRPEGNERGTLIQIRFYGSNRIEPVGLDPLPHTTNYFIGNDPDGWLTGVRSYRKVCYPNIYDGIDLTFYFREGRLKYDFTVLPGASPSSIKLVFDGVDDLYIDKWTGDLVIRTEVGSLIDSAPQSFQDLSGSQASVPSEYRIIGEKMVGYSINEYNKGSPLLIDPGIMFSTYIGGSNGDGYSHHTIDGHGNLYITGITRSSDFPVSVGAYDRSLGGGGDYVLVKLNRTGSKLHYATYIGGGGYEEDKSFVALDSEGNAIVAGITPSTDFPTTSGVIQSTSKGGSDGVLFKVNSTGGSLIFSTYIGGSDSDTITGVCLDGNGDIFISGYTESSDFPVINGCYDTSYAGGGPWGDGFLLKCDMNATRIIYGTYLGGIDTDKIDGIYVDGAGYVYAFGCTYSTDFPTTVGAFDRTYNGSSDWVIVKLNPTLSHLVLGTYIGGTEKDYVGNMVVEATGCVYLSGTVDSSDFPTTPNVYDRSHNGGQDWCILKLNASFDKLLSSTFIGGSGDDRSHDIWVDANGTVYSYGLTMSVDFPVTSNAIDSTFNTVVDLAIVTLDGPLRNLTFGTYVGGSVADWSASMEMSYPYITIVGTTNSGDFPTSQNAFDRTYNGGGNDLFACSLWIHLINASEPSEPLNLVAEPGDGIVNLTWDLPVKTGGLDLVGYHVYRGTEADNMGKISKVGARYTIFQDVDPPTFGTPIYYSVSAFNLFAEGNRSIVANVTCFSSPGPPVNFQALPGIGAVTLTWSPPDEIGGKSILGYRVFRGISYSNVIHLIDLGNITVYNDDEGLELGRKYYYRVVAFNSVGNGTVSDSASAVPVGPLTEPRYLMVGIGDSQLSLEWRAPQSDGGKSILGYRLFKGTSEDSLEELTTVEYYVTSYTDSEIVNGVTYYYAIQAFNEVKDGPLSSIVSGTPVGLPGVPSNYVVEAGDSQVILSWVPPEVDGGTDILMYEVFRGTTDTTLESIDVTNSEVNTYTDGGLLNGMTFFYATCAANKVGNGPWTEVISATPLALPDAPGDLVAIAGNGIVTISWSRPLKTGGAEVTKYNIHRGTSENDLELFTTNNKSVLINDDSDVVVGTTYYYAVAAVTAVGEGPKSIIASATPYGPPGIPTDLVATPGDSEVSLHWSAPGNDGASPIVGYVVMRGESTASLREVAQLGDVSSYLDTSVTNGITYLYIIAAINEAGPGEYTEPVPATPIKSPTAPGKVTTLVADAEGAKVTLQWSKPQDDGGSPVTGYVILRGLTKDSLEQIAEVGPAVTTWSEDGLKRGTTYYYSVAAKNVVGEGEAILAREVKVPPKADESPGFEVLAVMLALLIVVPILTRRR